MDVSQLESTDDTATLLERLGEELRRRGAFHELFEVLKLRLRHRLGLPLLYHDSADALEPEDRQQLERGLIDACRDVGMELFRAGKPGEGWLYLQAVGERHEAADVLKSLPVNDSTLDEIIHVALYEGVDVAYGFRLLLQHHGICNSITTFESMMRERSRDEQQAAATLLLDQLYEDVVENVRADLTERGAAPSADATLGELIEGHDELFEQDRYHVDTSHLAAVVRASRLLDEPQAWKRAWELSEYGRRLSALYQLPDDEPFTDFYGGHARFFEVLMGRDKAAVDEGLAYFRSKSESVEDPHEADHCKEVYLDLLLRAGRPSEAIREGVRLFTERIPPNLLGALLDVAARQADFDTLLDYARAKDDLLTYGTLLALRLDCGRSAADEQHASKSEGGQP